jgi:plastocyanin
MPRFRTAMVVTGLLPLAAALSWGFWGRSVIVKQEAKRFDADRLAIRPGDKIVFQNHDEITHNIYSATKGNEFNINVQRPGASTGVTFWNEGEVEVRCAIHPKMKVIISIAKDNPKE